MGSLYSGTSVSGYNSNPPPDDGSTGATNKITWSAQKTKLGDPLNTAIAAMSTAIVTAFGKTVDGGTLVTTAVDYPMTSADQGRVIKVTVSGKTVTTPDAGTVLAPFVFVVINQSTGTITIAGNATNSQTVDGQTTQVIKSGSGCFLFTDGMNWYTSGLKAAQLTSANPPYGFDAPVNLQLNASVGSSLLTVAVKTNSGNDPTPGDPVLIPFRDATIANGDPVWLSITSALSINTNATGATLGSSNNVPFRFWIVAFNNAGTVVLGLINCSNSTTIFPLVESNVQSTTGISAAATSAGVFYTPNGTTLSSCAFRIIGWLEYSSGLTTAGTYASVPTKLQLFGPGQRLPGQCVQVASSTSSSTAQSAFSLSITPTSSANLIKVNIGAQPKDTVIRSLTYKRASTTIFTQTFANSNASNIQSTCCATLLDAPGTTSSTAYSINSPASDMDQGWLYLEELVG